MIKGRNEFIPQRQIFIPKSQCWKKISIPQRENIYSSKRKYLFLNTFHKGEYSFPISRKITIPQTLLGMNSCFWDGILKVNSIIPFLLKSTKNFFKIFISLKLLHFLRNDLVSHIFTLSIFKKFNIWISTKTSFYTKSFDMLPVRNEIMPQ